MTAIRVLAVVAAWSTLVPSATFAQGTGRDWPGRIDVTIGAAWSSAHSLGTATAELLTNQVPRGSAFPLFVAATELRPAVGVDIAIGYHLTQAFGVEAFATRSNPVMRTTVSADPELAVGGSAEESLMHYRVGATAVLHLPSIALADGRVVPFVLGGAAYLREAFDRGNSTSTGRVYHVGTGVRVLLLERSGARFLKAVGVRGDVRVHRRDGGLEIDDRSRTFLTASIGLVVAP